MDDCKNNEMVMRKYYKMKEANYDIKYSVLTTLISNFVPTSVQTFY